jgi:uncharacterized protein YdhG (YjbR/CyaY superfamily)
LAAQPEDVKTALASLRQTITATAPDAVESISYDIPTFKYRGKPLIYFAAHQRHCALYGIDVAAHAGDLAGYETSPKGTVRFTPDQSLPEALVRKLVVARMATIDAASRRTRKRP